MQYSLDGIGERLERRVTQHTTSGDSRRARIRMCCARDNPLVSGLLASAERSGTGDTEYVQCSDVLIDA
jgi:hypothetical protein